jgi:hypothetical protein
MAHRKAVREDEMATVTTSDGTEIFYKDWGADQRRA